MKKKPSKFEVGESVAYKNNSSFNPANKVITIGKVEAIHFHHGRDITYRPNRGEIEPKSLKGKISYTISGLSIIPWEEDLQKWED